MERLSIHGQTRRMKLNPPRILIRIEGLLSGGQDRVDQSQDGTRNKKKGKMNAILYLLGLVLLFLSDIFIA